MRKSVNCKAIFPMEKLSNNVEQSKKEYADFMDKGCRGLQGPNLLKPTCLQIAHHCLVGSFSWKKK
ncbi:hypothetical protein HPP92_001704 [Vanilla planifolia]|uniref:Uncharacterized protein n=1 Tax=Vanilla planifolia TaxID=51239 RepID=A0A835SDC9_VANPL|nr:hypothetical protein HPP92_001704 [Vanilla planifolia]